jgi:hypothetical protein
MDRARLWKTRKKYFEAASSDGYTSELDLTQGAEFGQVD